MEEGGRIEECRVFWIAEMADILRTGKLEQRAAFRKQELFFFVDTARTCRGTKASWLSDWAQRTGRAFVRFDYSGHGLSSGSFSDGTIGAWHRDVLMILDRLCLGP